MSAAVLTEALRRLLLHAIEEAAELGEVRHLTPGGPTRGGLVPVAVPARLTVSLESLDLLATLAGFAGGLAEAFEEAGGDPPPPMGQRH